MYTLPHNHLLDVNFPSITAFVEAWARQYEGKPPKKWLLLQRQLGTAEKFITNEKMLEEWNQAWSCVYEQEGAKAFYCILNIINAVNTYAHVNEKDPIDVIKVYHTFFDHLPCATELWIDVIKSWCYDENLINYTELFLASLPASNTKLENNVFIASMLLAFQKTHFTLLHQTHPNESLADLIVELGWSAFSFMYDKNTILASQAYGTYPWEVYEVLTHDVSSAIDTSLDDLI